METETVLRALRQRRGESMSGVARKSGVDLSLLSHIESGRRLMSGDVALKSAGVLGVDPVLLSIAHNTAALKARVESGQDPPQRAATLATALLRMLEGGELSDEQQRAARSAVVELVKLIEEHATSAGTLADLARSSVPGGGTAPSETPDRETEYGALMDALDRDIRGRRKKPRRGGDAVDLDMSGFPESGEYARKSGTTTYEELGRDSFGRRRP